MGFFLGFAAGGMAWNSGARCLIEFYRELRRLGIELWIRFWGFSRGNHVIAECFMS